MESPTTSTFFELRDFKRNLAWVSVSAFIGIVSIVWFVEDRFVNMQIDIAEQRALVKSEVEFKQMLKTDPSNEDLKEGLEEVREEKREVRERIAKRLQ